MSMKMKDLPNGEYFVTMKAVVLSCAADPQPGDDELRVFQKVEGLNNANAISDGRSWQVDDDCIVIRCAL